MIHKLRKTLFVLFSAIALSTVAAGALPAMASITAPAAHAQQQRRAECSGTAFRHGEGIQGIANITFAEGDWECNAQNLDLQISVTSRSVPGGSCGRSTSGIVHSLEVNDKATGAANYFCDGWARWRCRHSRCSWTSWRDLETLSQPGTLATIPAP